MLKTDFDLTVKSVFCGKVSSARRVGERVAWRSQRTLELSECAARCLARRDAGSRSADWRRGCVRAEGAPHTHTRARSADCT